MYKRIFCVLLAVVLSSRISLAQTKQLDAFESLTEWKTIASDGVRIDLALVGGRTGKCIKIDFDFVAGAGYCGIQKQLPMALPENFQFSFYLRGVAPSNNLEFKLVDESGDNVWWLNQRNFEFPQEWTKIAIKKRHLSFAWGPATDRSLKAFDKVEFFVASASGGKGSIYIDDFSFQELEPPADTLPKPVISAATRTGNKSQLNLVLDGNPQTHWRSSAKPEQQSLVLDLGKSCEFGGLIIDWDQQDFAHAYNILLSPDGKAWETAYAVATGKPGRSYIYLRDQQTRFLKLDLLASARQQGYAIAEVSFQRIEFAESPEAFFSRIALDHPRGYFPKYLQREQSYWTVVGVNNDTKEALINEEGMIEVDKSSFSLMPFIFYNGKLLTWNDVACKQSLEKNYLPIPTVIWWRSGFPRPHPDLQLDVTTFASGTADSSSLYAIYRLTNHTRTKVQGNFYLTIRPFQVNPPAQFLNWPGGTAKVKSIHREDGAIIINEKKKLLPLSAYDNFGALTFDEGDITEFISRDTLPSNSAITDHFGYASAALQYRFELAPSEEKIVSLAIPFHKQHVAPLQPAEQAREDITEFWKEKVNTVELRLPASAPPLANLVRSNLAYILINRDRAGIQPGSRSYDRSWIRDGALTSAALLRFGIKQEVREFIDWYAQYQYPNGKIPCVVDTRGADPVPENDSHGEFIYAVLQYFRFTNDTLWLRQKFPQVVKTVEYIEFLRNQRKTEIYANGTPEQRACYGLLPESISHEGYSAKPMHSYWDDFFGVKGLKDATTIAAILGEREYEKDFAAARDDFQKNLYASMRMAMANKGIDYIPGCVELGDFDATSTTIGLDPCGELANIPQPQLNNTFEKYYQFFSQRRDGKIEWKDYTPYEVRSIGAFILLDQKERAHELLNFFLNDQRPPAWNHWAEVVWRNPKETKFIGDMPHTWVGSDFIRAVRNMFVYETDDEALVIGAGILEDWVRDSVGVAVKHLPTYYGILDYKMKMDGDHLNIELNGNLQMPPGKVIVRPPVAASLKAVQINGKSSKAFDSKKVIVNEFPAKIVLGFAAR